VNGAPLAVLAVAAIVWPSPPVTADAAAAEHPDRVGEAPQPTPPAAAPWPRAEVAERARAAGCRFFAPEAHRVATAECVACHQGHDAHPVDVDLDARALRAGSSLRPAAEVVRRGVYLDGGRITCLSCHDARSRWAARLALPPGARVRTAVDPRNPASYLARAPETVDGRHLPDGTAVSPTPLCRACHTHGD
jgi:hypothetical protein